MAVKHQRENTSNKSWKAIRVAQEPCTPAKGIKRDIEAVEPCEAFRLIDPVDQRPELRCSPEEWEKYMMQCNAELEIIVAEKYVQRMGFHDALLPELVFGDLSNDIDPIFAPQNWPLENFSSDADSDLWRAPEPTLRLATHLLTSAAALAFFRRFRFGIETINPETGRTYLEYTEPCAITRADQENIVLQDLHTLSSRLKFFFAALKPQAEEGQVHAITIISQDLFGERILFQGGLSQLPDEGSGCIYALLNPAYREYARSIPFD